MCESRESREPGEIRLGGFAPFIGANSHHPWQWYVLNITETIVEPTIEAQKEIRSDQENEFDSHTVVVLLFFNSSVSVIFSVGSG